MMWGINTSVNVVQVTLADSVAQEVLGPNPRRVGFIVSLGYDAGQWAMSLRSDVTKDTGIFSAQNSFVNQVYASLDNIGDAITLPWYAVQKTSPTGVITILEILRDD